MGTEKEKATKAWPALRPNRMLAMACLRKQIKKKSKQLWYFLRYVLLHPLLSVNEVQG